jgi:hypothetical protein
MKDFFFLLNLAFGKVGEKELRQRLLLRKMIAFALGTCTKKDVA